METVDREWTVLSWNIQGAKHTDPDRLAAVIAAESPDVVVVQEARRPQADELAKRLSMSHCWAEKHNPYRPLFPGQAEGLAILTPHVLSADGSTRVSDASSKRNYRRRIVQWATISRSDATGYRVYNAHLSPHDMVAERLAEARRISEIVDGHGESPPAVVAGDLNDHGDPQVIAALPGIEMLSAPATNPSQAPTQVLDHVLVPADATNVSIGAPSGSDAWAELSDHLPVTVRFSLGWVAGGFAD